MKQNITCLLFFLALASASLSSNSRHLLTKTQSTIEFDAGSLGCQKKIPHGMSAGTVIEKTIEIQDPRLGSISRRYTIAIPNDYDQNTPAPFLMHLHGQGDVYPWHGWTRFGTKKGLIVVEPRGMDDHESGVIAWNDGQLDFGKEKSAKTCFKDTLVGRCYTSCKKLDYLCTPCSYATCYDDGLFIQKLIESIKSDYCVNLSRVYAHGYSAGSQMIYYLVGRFPNMFNAVIPYFGISLVGLGVIPDNAKNIDLQHMHDRTDRTIPMEGVCEDGWVFESVESTHERWAREQECTMEMGLRNFTTPYDGGERNLSCVRKHGCVGEIIRCTYDGGHGDTPKKGLQLSWWFLERVYENRKNQANKTKLESI